MMSRVAQIAILAVFPAALYAGALDQGNMIVARQDLEVTNIPDGVGRTAVGVLKRNAASRILGQYELCGDEDAFVCLPVLGLSQAGDGSLVSGWIQLKRRQTPAQLSRVASFSSVRPRDSRPDYIAPSARIDELVFGDLMARIDQLEDEVVELRRERDAWRARRAGLAERGRRRTHDRAEPRDEDDGDPPHFRRKPVDYTDGWDPRDYFTDPTTVDDGDPPHFRRGPVDYTEGWDPNDYFEDPSTVDDGDPPYFGPHGR